MNINNIDYQLDATITAYLYIMVMWYNVPTMLPAGSRKRGGCIIPQAVTHSLVLLKMGKIIARNMLS